MVGLLCSLHARRYARAAEDHRAATSQIVPEKGVWRYPSMVAQLVVRAGGRERGRKRESGAERMCRTEPTEPTEWMMWRGTLVLRRGKLARVVDASGVVIDGTTTAWRAGRVTTFIKANSKLVVGRSVRTVATTSEPVWRAMWRGITGAQEGPDVPVGRLEARRGRADSLTRHAEPMAGRPAACAATDAVQGLAVGLIRHGPETPAACFLRQ